MNTIEVDHLSKRFGAKVAVDDVSFTVAAGEIFGLLGRNGAGKSTTVDCLAGLRAPDRGRVRVAGLDPRTDRHELPHWLGIQLQESELPDKLTVIEAMRLYASFYRRPASIPGLLDELDLTGKRNTRYRRLSGGQKQRLSIALALIGRPRVAILDELTTGLDPVARRDTWDLIKRIRDQGVTIMLVTHFMEEAERLCDRVAIMHSGRVAATGTPAELGSPTLEDTFVTLTSRRS
jgi:ABC-2 type transport system ATP-binding protein